MASEKQTKAPRRDLEDEVVPVEAPQPAPVDPFDRVVKQSAQAFSIDWEAKAKELAQEVEKLKQDLERAVADVRSHREQKFAADDALRRARAEIDGIRYALDTMKAIMAKGY